MSNVLSFQDLEATSRSQVYRLADHDPVVSTGGVGVAVIKLFFCH
jgi:hypothetical protein